MLLLLAGVLLLLLVAPDVPLLAFAGVLLAVALRLPAEWVAAQTGLGRRAAVLALAAGLAGLLGFLAWLAAAPLAEQAAALARRLPESLAALRGRIEALPVGGAWLAARLDPQTLLGQGDAAATVRSAAAAAAGGTLGVLGNAVLVLLAGIYMAVRPRDYLGGLRALLAPRLEAPARAAFAECRQVLRGWLLGQGFAMAVSGLLTWLGLTLLGVPLAGALAAITAVLGFIPYLGPVIAAVPAMLLALAATDQPLLPLWVAALYIGVQSVEGNVLTPLVQARAADLPPALLLLAQALMGALFGLLGVALAAPAAAVALVLVRRGYVEGWLGHRPAAGPETG